MMLQSHFGHLDLTIPSNGFMIPNMDFPILSHSPIKNQGCSKPLEVNYSEKQGKGSVFLFFLAIYSNIIYPLVIQHSYWTWPIYIWFTYWRWWFTIAMLVCQRFNHPCSCSYRMLLVRPTEAITALLWTHLATAPGGPWFRGWVPMAPGGRREGGHGAWVKKAPAGGEKKDEEVDFKGRIFADHLGYIWIYWIYLGKFHHDLTATEPWKSCFFKGESSPNGDCEVFGP